MIDDYEQAFVKIFPHNAGASGHGSAKLGWLVADELMRTSASLLQHTLNCRRSKRPLPAPRACQVTMVEDGPQPNFVPGVADGWTQPNSVVPSAS